MTNLEDYVSFIVDATTNSGISRQVEAFKSGFNQVFENCVPLVKRLVNYWLFLVDLIDTDRNIRRIFGENSLKDEYCVKLIVDVLSLFNLFTSPVMLIVIEVAWSKLNCFTCFLKQCNLG